MKAGTLTPQQLTDLVNYVLELPQYGVRAVARERIDVLVVKTWSRRYERRRVEHWCECQLMQVGLLPKPKAGRWHPNTPKILWVWAGMLRKLST